MRRFIPLVLLAVGLAFFSGCKQKQVKVSGRIVRDGQPMSFPSGEGMGQPPVTLFFIPAEGKQDRYPAKIDFQAGTYEVELPPGKYQASVYVAPTDPSKPSGPPPTAVQGDVYTFTDKSNTQDIPVPK